MQTTATPAYRQKRKRVKRSKLEAFHTDKTNSVCSQKPKIDTGFKRTKKENFYLSHSTGRCNSVYLLRIK